MKIYMSASCYAGWP